MILIKYPNLKPKGLTIFPFVFYRGDIDDTFIRHERIHLRQQVQLLVLPFFILYLFFYVQNRILGLRPAFAYHAIPFELEAYANQHDPNYKSFYGWIKYYGSNN